VYRVVDGERCRFAGPKVYWLETYATRKHDTDEPNAMWADRPRGQLEKCAEAAALRAAFPEEIGDELSSDEAPRVAGGGLGAGGGVIESTATTVAGGPAGAPAAPAAEIPTRSREVAQRLEQFRRERDGGPSAPAEPADQADDQVGDAGPADAAPAVADDQAAGSGDASADAASEDPPPADLRLSDLALQFEERLRARDLTRERQADIKQEILAARDLQPFEREHLERIIRENVERFSTRKRQ
jgi:hypothetical protein